MSNIKCITACLTWHFSPVNFSIKKRLFMHISCRCIISQHKKQQHWNMNFKKYVGQLLKASLIPFIYYFDIFADSIFLYDLGVNCHWRYLLISAFILSVSYISTVFYLKFRLLLSWKRSLLYPHYHSKDIFRRLWIALRGNMLSSKIQDMLDKE